MDGDIRMFPYLPEQGEGRRSAAYDQIGTKFQPVRTAFFGLKRRFHAVHTAFQNVFSAVSAFIFRGNFHLNNNTLSPSCFLCGLSSALQMFLPVSLLQG